VKTSFGPIRKEMRLLPNAIPPLRITWTDKGLSDQYGQLLIVAKACSTWYHRYKPRHDQVCKRDVWVRGLTTTVTSRFFNAFNCIFKRSLLEKYCSFHPRGKKRCNHIAGLRFLP